MYAARQLSLIAYAVAGRMLRALDTAFANAHLFESLVQYHGFCVQDVSATAAFMHSLAGCDPSIVSSISKAQGYRGSAMLSSCASCCRCGCLQI